MVLVSLRTDYLVGLLNLHLQTMTDGSTLSALGAEVKLAADFFKVLTMSRTKLIRGLLLVVIALDSS